MIISRKLFLKKYIFSEKSGLSVALLSAILMILEICIKRMEGKNRIPLVEIFYPPDGE